jgi:RNA polymerase sigma-54 factor
MGPAIALRLRQHLTLTPQVQQALRLLQMSALEFGQEMEQALTANPFLEENPDATPQAEAAAEPHVETTTEARMDPEIDMRVPQEGSSGSASSGSEREGDDWGGASDQAETLSDHLRQQLMLSQMGERDRALTHMIVDSLDDDGYFKMSFEELAALVPPEHDVRPEELGASLRLIQSLEPAGVGARTLEECLLLQLQALPAATAGRDCAMLIVRGNLTLLANREWARLQHAVGCDEATLHKARALIRSLDPKPGQRFGAHEARYVIPDVIVRKNRGCASTACTPTRSAAGAPRTSRSGASCRKRAGCCAASSSASPPSSASPIPSSRASAAFSSTARWR